MKTIIAWDLWKYRRSNGLTQNRMAQLLSITERAYSDLEHGKYCCSAVVLVRFLRLLSPQERDDLLSRLCP